MNGSSPLRAGDAKVWNRIAASRRGSSEAFPMIQMTDELYQTWRRGHDMVAKLDKLFVVGCAKSGTTWVMKLLNGHPGIVIRGEGGFTYQLVPLLSQAFRVFNEHQRRQDQITHLRDVDLLLTARAVIDGQLARYVEESGRDPLSVRVVGDKTPQPWGARPTLSGGQVYSHHS